jgi:RNA polymerase sigma factor (sigma-70 family)
MNRYQAFWAAAYENHFDRLCSRARRLTNGDAAEAEDLVGEAFLRAIMYVKHPEDIVNLFAYLWTTARRVLIVKRMRDSALPTESLDAMIEAGREPKVEPEVFRVLERKELEAAMTVGQGPLTSREKQLLRLHLLGYACGEIAARMGEDVRVTRTDLNAVRAKVRYRLSCMKK